LKPFFPSRATGINQHFNTQDGKFFWPTVKSGQVPGENLTKPVRPYQESVTPYKYFSSNRDHVGDEALNLAFKHKDSKDEEDLPINLCLEDPLLYSFNTALQKKEKVIKRSFLIFLLITKIFFMI